MARKKPIRRAIKRFLPNNLFSRALLILLVPMISLQLVTAYMFYERHWESVVRTLSTSVSSEIALLVEEYRRASADGHDNAILHTKQLGRRLNMHVEIYENKEAHPIVEGRGTEHFSDPYYGLKRRLALPLMIEQLRQEELIRVRLELHDGMMDVTMNKKRLISPTTLIFIVWMVGSAIILSLIASLFLRNQVKPIVQLARAAQQFGMGQDVQNYSPRGASEVRRAGNSFLVMADRVRRSVASRTEMLAGISHDLRTPLTRMKLEMEMGTIDAATRDALTTDIDEMRRMIDEYLDFARGDAGEEMTPTDLTMLITELAEGYQRSHQPVHWHGAAADPTVLMLRPQALRRALGNLVENALRYGEQATIALETSATFVRVRIIDLGPGIPQSEHEAVFKPFTRLEASRNLDTGGVGLGLSIARDIAQSHGGNITLENQVDALGNIMGLEVTLHLPRQTLG